MKQPIINIIIPNYNGSSLLRPCLDSICSQTYIHYTITVVDNGSTDHSLDVLSEFEHFVNIIFMKKNSGFSKAVNQGIMETDGELVLVLNNDTVLHKNCLSRIINGFNTFPDYGSYAPKVVEFINPEQIHSTGLMLSYRGYGNRSQRYSLKSLSHPTEIFGACGAAAVYRRTMLNKVGLFNEKFFFFYEDVELSFRQQLLGYKCLYLPSALVYHHGRATMRNFFPVAVKEAVKNSLITIITCTPFTMFKKYAFDIIGFYIKFIWEIIKKGYVKEVLLAIFYLLKNFHSIVLTRKKLQKDQVENDYLDSLLYRGDIFINFLDEVVRIN